MNDYQNVTRLLNENVNLKYYYGIDNISALARAMMNNSVEVVNLLMSRNAQLGPHESFFVDTNGFYRVVVKF
jgi:ankyrin repeat protein